MKRVLIPINNDKLSKDFKRCSHFLVYEIFNEHISEKKYHPSDVLYQKKFLSWIITNGVSDVIAYNIDYKTIELLLNTKVDLFIGIGIDKPNKLIENYLNGKLISNTNLIKNKKGVLTN